VLLRANYQKQEEKKFFSFFYLVGLLLARLLPSLDVVAISPPFFF
jgi:hypothetical protein